MNLSFNDATVFTVSMVYEIVLIPYYEAREIFLRTNETTDCINRARARMNKGHRN